MGRVRHAGASICGGSHWRPTRWVCHGAGRPDAPIASRLARACVRACVKKCSCAHVSRSSSPAGGLIPAGMASGLFVSFEFAKEEIRVAALELPIHPGGNRRKSDMEKEGETEEGKMQAYSNMGKMGECKLLCTCDIDLVCMFVFAPALTVKPIFLGVLWSHRSHSRVCCPCQI